MYGYVCILINNIIYRYIGAEGWWWFFLLLFRPERITPERWRVYYLYTRAWMPKYCIGTRALLQQQQADDDAESLDQRLPSLSRLSFVIIIIIFFVFLFLNIFSKCRDIRAVALWHFTNILCSCTLWLDKGYGRFVCKKYCEICNG